MGKQWRLGGATTDWMKGSHPVQLTKTKSRTRLRLLWSKITSPCDFGSRYTGPKAALLGELERKSIYIRPFPLNFLPN